MWQSDVCVVGLRVADGCVCGSRCVADGCVCGSRCVADGCVCGRLVCDKGDWHEISKVILLSYDIARHHVNQCDFLFI